MSQTSERRGAGMHELHWGWRVCLTSLGALAMAASFSLFLRPPTRQSTTRHPTELIVERTQADPTAYAGVLLAAGATLIAIAANGRRVARLSKDGAEFDVPTESQVVGAEKRSATPIEISDEPPVTSATPDRTFTKDGYEYQVFDAQNVPVKVLTALSGKDCIKALTDVDYAFRRTGKGNHTWFVRVKSGDTIGVSFGGQGKSTATVSQA